MTLDQIETEVRAALARLNRPDPGFRFARASDGSGAPHIEGDGPVWDWVCCERGKEVSRRPVEAQDLLFLTLSAYTARMAREAELRTRTRFEVAQRARPGFGGLVRKLSGAEPGAIADDYSRKTWMDGHVRLMAHLRRDWGVLQQQEYDAILRRYPLTPDERRNTRRLDLTAFGLDP